MTVVCLSQPCSDVAHSAETAKEKVIDLLLGILYFVVGGIECFAIFVAAFVSSPRRQMQVD